MFCIVHNSIQEFTIISITGMFITIMDLYLDYLNYRTALVASFIPVRVRDVRNVTDTAKATILQDTSRQN